MTTYYRVTDILKPFSGLSHVPEDILRAAAERGSFIHAVFDAQQSGMGHPDVPEAWSGYIKSLDSWKEGKNFITKPPRWFSDTHPITGECDGIYKDGDDYVLFDIKTTAKEGSTWFLQGSAYAHLARKAGYDIKRIEFVRLKKDGKVPCVYIYQENFDLFLACLQTYLHFFREVPTAPELEYL